MRHSTRCSNTNLDVEFRSMKPNTSFSLSVTDIDYIEAALLRMQVDMDNDEDKKNIVELLAKIYHQKVWYRPKKQYVSG